MSSVYYYEVIFYSSQDTVLHIALCWFIYVLRKDFFYEHIENFICVDPNYVSVYLYIWYIPFYFSFISEMWCFQNVSFVRNYWWYRYSES